MDYYKNDLQLFYSKFGNDVDIWLSSKGSFNTDGSLKTGSFFLSKTDLYFIREKENLAYKIPYSDITDHYRNKKRLTDELIIEYGGKYSSTITMYDTGSYTGTMVLLKLTLPIEHDKAQIQKDRINNEKLFKEKEEELNLLKQKQEESIKDEEKKLIQLKEDNAKEIEAEKSKLELLKHETNIKLNLIREEGISQIERDKNKLTKKIEDKEKLIEELEYRIKLKKNELKTINNHLDDKKLQLDYKDIFVRHFEENITSAELNDKLSILNLKEKEMIKNNNAVKYDGFEDTKKFINSQVKQIIRSFDTECNYFFSNLNGKNYESYHNRIIKSYETLNRIYEIDEVMITESFLKIKLEKLNLIHQKELKVQQEREIQREIKEQMKEEERVRRELENERKKIEKEEKQFGNEVKTLFKRLEKSNNDVEKELYAEKIKQLEAKINELENDKKDVENREANTRAGYVYVISNIGSFGEDVYKIGMTRRLEPLDRVKELGDASVPFSFDVHAMIFSEDAPKLENALHKHFRDREINKVNHRKEFFKVNIDEIEEVVMNNHNNTVEFTKLPLAEQYWESQNISQNMKEIEELV
ncbi:DUF4041 domain-containing protein [Staphylococcus gallinarum]|uniref:DUF4041 domain-containing protein n=1 Tax=Staphylococcus gallinarum TaxID=1293 RepID=UPI0030BC2E73